MSRGLEGNESLKLRGVWDWSERVGLGCNLQTNKK